MPEPDLLLKSAARLLKRWRSMPCNNEHTTYLRSNHADATEKGLHDTGFCQRHCVFKDASHWNAYIADILIRHSIRRNKDPKVAVQSYKGRRKYIRKHSIKEAIPSRHLRQTFIAMRPARSRVAHNLGPIMADHNL